MAPSQHRVLSCTYEGARNQDASCCDRRGGLSLRSGSTDRPDEPSTPRWPSTGIAMGESEQLQQDHRCFSVFSSRPAIAGYDLIRRLAPVTRSTADLPMCSSEKPGATRGDSHSCADIGSAKCSLRYRGRLRGSSRRRRSAREIAGSMKEHAIWVAASSCVSGGECNLGRAEAI